VRVSGTVTYEMAVPALGVLAQLADAGDDASQRLSLVIAGLLALAVVIGVATVVFWRLSAPDRPKGARGEAEAPEAADAAAPEPIPLASDATPSRVARATAAVAPPPAATAGGPDGDLDAVPGVLPMVLATGWGSGPRPADTSDPERFDRSIAAIDAANAEDPNTVDVDEQDWPKELLHSHLMTMWLWRLDPESTELAHLAARAHHFRRWTRPRSDYPDGRAGYLRWRAAAKRTHAAEVAELLASHGFSPEQTERVGAIIRKDELGTDPVVQTHEDAVCLVFLSTQLEQVADQLGDERMVGVLARTIPKMSPAGLAAAGSLPLDERGAELLAAAVGVASDEDRSGS